MDLLLEKRRPASKNESLGSCFPLGNVGSKVVLEVALKSIFELINVTFEKRCTVELL